MERMQTQKAGGDIELRTAGRWRESSSNALATRGWTLCHRCPFVFVLLSWILEEKDRRVLAAYTLVYVIV